MHGHALADIMLGIEVPLRCSKPIPANLKSSDDRVLKNCAAIARQIFSIMFRPRPLAITSKITATIRGTQRPLIFIIYFSLFSAATVPTISRTLFRVTGLWTSPFTRASLRSLPAISSGNSSAIYATAGIYRSRLSCR